MDDIDEVTTLDDLATAIQIVVTRSGMTDREIVRRADLLAGTGRTDDRTFSRAALGYWRRGKHLPRWDALRTLLLVCGVPDRELDGWQRALGRVQRAPERIDRPVPRPVDEPPHVPDDPAHTGFNLLRTTLLAATLLGIVCAALLALTDDPAVRAVALVALVLVVVAVLGVLVVGVRREARPQRVDPETTIAAWATELDTRWSAAIADQQRPAQPALTVGWTVERPDPALWAEAVQAGTDVDEAEPDRSRLPEGRQDGGGGQLAATLAELLPGHRLILVGASGSGKSVLLLAAARELHARTLANPGSAPHPVLFALAGWDPRQPLDEWLAAQMVRDEPRMGEPTRPGGPGIAAALLAAGRVLPVLDGLDEAGDARARRAVLRGIDEWLAERPRPGLLVATQPMPDGEQVGPDVELAPRGTFTAHVDELAADRVGDYLRGHTGHDWTDLLDGPAGATLTGPLTVSLAAAGYPRVREPDDPGPAELAELDDARVRDRLLARLLPAMYRSAPRGWTPAKAATWLATIARTTRPSGRPPGPFYWWHLHRHTPRLLVPGLLGLAPGCAVGLVAGVDGRLGIGIGVGILAGLAAGGLALLALRRSGTADAGTGHNTPPDVGPGIAAGFAAGAVGALAGGALAVWLGLTDDVLRGMMGGLGAGIAAGAATGPRAGAVGGLVGGAAVALSANTATGWSAGVVDGAAVWLATVIVVDRHAVDRPARGWQRPRWWVAIVTALTCGSVIGAQAWLRHGAGWGVLAGLVVGVSGGIAAGLSVVAVEPTGLSANPAELLGSERRRFMAMAALGGLSFGVGAGVAVQPSVGVAAAITVGLVAGATRTTWPAFALARWHHALRGRLPLQLMTFLHDGHTLRAVLRRNGAGFEIRHRELLEHLLGSGQTPTSENATGPGTPNTVRARR